MNDIKYYAKATIAALTDSYKSVTYTNLDAFDTACEQLEQGKPITYMGVKDTPVLQPIVAHLKEHGYVFHTLDKASINGRAIDMTLVNPLTGRYMTGSSSGTAVNVFTGINQIGVGTDGGGSVLAPAMSLNLYAFMSPILPVEKVEKHSTDNLAFTPSAGIISRNWHELATALKCFGLQEKNDEPIRIAIPIIGTKKTVLQVDIGEQLQVMLAPITNVVIEQIEFPDLAVERTQAIAFLEKVIHEYDLVATIEGPIDVLQYGDSVMGNFSEFSKAQQEQSGKGFMRIANMANASSTVIPSNEIASGYVLYSQTTIEKINKQLAVAACIKTELPAVVERYFHQAAQNRVQTYFK